MKKSTVIGLLLLVLLFIWSMTISTNRAQQQAVEKSKTEQAAPARNSSLSVPELSVLDSSRLIPATLAPTKAKEPAVAKDSAISDSAKGTAPIARKKIRVENEHFTVVFDNLGAKISSIVVKALPDSAEISRKSSGIPLWALWDLKSITSIFRGSCSPYRKIRRIPFLSRATPRSCSRLPIRTATRSSVATDSPSQESPSGRRFRSKDSSRTTMKSFGWEA